MKPILIKFQTCRPQLYWKNEQLSCRTPVNGASEPRPYFSFIVNEVRDSEGTIVPVGTLADSQTY